MSGGILNFIVVACFAIVPGATASSDTAMPVQQGELIERTLALVGGQVITLSDVRTALTLGLVDAPSGSGGSSAFAKATADKLDATAVAGATAKLIERLLMLREVERYAPPEPADSAVDAQLALIRARFDSPATYARALEAGGFTEARVRAWIRDDLRIAAYLEQRFAAAGERRNEMIVDWVSELRRRTVVVDLQTKP